MITQPAGATTLQPEAAPVFHPVVELPQITLAGGGLTSVPTSAPDTAQTATAAKVPVPEAPKIPWCSASDVLLRLAYFVSIGAGVFFSKTAETTPETAAGVIFLGVGGGAAASDVVDKFCGGLAKMKQVANAFLNLYNTTLGKVTEAEAKVEEERKKWDIEKGEFQKQVEAAGNTEKKIDTDNSRIANSVAALQQEKEDLKKTLQERETQLNEQKALLATAKQRVEELGAAHQRMGSDLQQIQTTVTSLRTENSTLLQRATEEEASLQGKLQEFKTENERLQTLSSSLESESQRCKDLDRELSEVKEKVATLSSELATLKQGTGDLSAVRAQYSEENQKLVQIKKELQSTEASLKGLLNQIDQAKAELSKLSAQIAQQRSADDAADSKLKGAMDHFLSVTHKQES